MPNQDVIVKYLFYSLDFVIIWAMIYWVLYFLRGTRSANVLFGVIAIFLTATIVVDHVERLTVLRFLLMECLMPVLGIAILVIFQPEFRRAFAQAGSIFVSNRTGRETIDQVVEAAAQLSITRTGAIIVFERNIGLTDTTRSAVSLDARVDSLLIQSIFYPNSPLHDCAVVIGKNNRIVAAHAVLPLAEAGNNVKRTIDFLAEPVLLPFDVAAVDQHVKRLLFGDHIIHRSVLSVSITDNKDLHYSAFPVVPAADSFSSISRILRSAFPL